MAASRQGNGGDGMRILAVSDVPSRAYYDFYTPGKLKDFDLILACGDLKKEYLEFLVTMANRPLLYVPGNHDESFTDRPPEGCVCIDGKVYEHQGVRFLGLGGSHKYREGAYQYTEREMAARVRRVKPAIRKSGGFDVLVTHAPARGLNDFDTLAHRGFECFNDLLDRYEPKYFVHGHIHKNYGTNLPRETRRGSTTVINAYEHWTIEF